MRIAIIADSHFSERSRFDECVRIHEWIAQDMQRRDVDLVLHSGDLFDAKSTPTERKAVADWLQRVAAAAPVVIVRGNHDALGDLPLMGRLKARHPITVEEAAGVHYVAGAAVACLAWPRKAELMARVDAGADSSTAASEALRAVLLSFRQQLEQHDGPRVLLTHAMVDGSTTSSGQPLVGCDMSVGVDDLALAGADLVALGHIHQHQRFESSDGASLVYPGSPRRTAFGELERKGYLVAEFSDGDPFRDFDWRFIETPATPMLLLEAVWDAEHGILFGLHRLTDVAGAEVRLRYVVPGEHREAARARAEEYRATALARGAVVKLEEVVETSVRARAPEVAEAKTLTDKLRAYWKAKGEDLGEREPSLLGKASQIEEEVAA